MTTSGRFTETQTAELDGAITKLEHLEARKRELDGQQLAALARAMQSIWGSEPPGGESDASSAGTAAPGGLAGPAAHTGQTGPAAPTSQTGMPDTANTHPHPGTPALPGGNRLRDRGITGSELAYRSLRLEVAAALHESEHVAERLLSMAYVTSEQFPTTLHQLRAGAISLNHVRVITDEGALLETGRPEVDGPRRAEYEREVLDYAAEETPNRLRPIARRLAARHSAATLVERHEAARDARCVRVTPAEHGMADLVAHLPAEDAYAIRDRIHALARAALRGGIPTGHTGSTGNVGSTGHTALSRHTGRAGHTDSTGHSESAATLPGMPGAPSSRVFAHATGAASSIGESAGGFPADSPAASSPSTAYPASRASATPASLAPADTARPNDLPAGRRSPQAAVSADVFRDLLLGEPDPARPGAGRISAHVQIVIPEHGAAELIGYGIIDESTASCLAGGADVWERVTVDDEGAVLAVDRYRPSAAMTRHLTARDLHCRAPGCRVPATRCDADHTIDAALGGETSTSNLAFLCRGHHVLKHHTDWQIAQGPGGMLEWTSPTGRVYADRPPSRVRFRRPTSPVPGSNASTNANANANTSANTNTNTGALTGADAGTDADTITGTSPITDTNTNTDTDTDTVIDTDTDTDIHTGTVIHRGTIIDADTGLAKGADQRTPPQLTTA